MSTNSKPKGKAGGEARAQSLSPEQRKEIARRAAAAKWGTPRATHDGTLNVAGWASIPCWVLEDERRIISQRCFMELIGMKESVSIPIGERVSQILDPRNSRSRSAVAFIEAVENPIRFLSTDSIPAHGYNGDIIVDFCRAILRARRAGCLAGAALEYADQAERLLEAVAKTGIAALIDEATGYQEIRDRKALEGLLDRYLLKEFSPWAKRFPDEFYKEIFRLRNWKWSGMMIKRPQCIGTYTNDLVYERLEVGILEELKVRNPWMPEKKRRAGHHHCLLTEDIGVPALAQHIYTLIVLMRGFKDGRWGEMVDFLDQTLPKKGASIQLLLGLRTD